MFSLILFLRIAGSSPLIPKPIYPLLKKDQGRSSTHNPNHNYQPPMVKWLIIRLEILGPVHETCNCRHYPQSDGLVSLCSLFTKLGFLRDCSCQGCKTYAMLTLLSSGPSQFNCNHVLCTGWYPMAKELTTVHSPHRLHFPTCASVVRRTINVIR